MTVVILPHTRDNESVEMVSEAIVARGGRPVRLDTDLFPTRVQLSIPQGGARTAGVLRTPEVELPLDEISAIWSMEDYIVFPAAESGAASIHGYGHYHETWLQTHDNWCIARLELRRTILESTPVAALARRTS